MFPILSKEFRAQLPYGLNHRTLSKLRLPQNLSIEYRKFEILHSLVIHCISIAIVPFNSAVLHFILFCNFMLIRHGHSLDNLSLALLIIWTLVLQGFWLMVLEVGGRFHKFSKSTLNSWKFLNIKDKCKKKYMKKFRKSCKPLYLGMQGYFVMNRLSVLKFLRGVIRGTFRTVVTLKETGL